MIRYAGKPLFKEMPATQERDVKNREKHRALSYRGSSRHFFRSLVKGQAEKEGFELYLSRLKADKTGLAAIATLLSNP